MSDERSVVGRVLIFVMTLAVIAGLIVLFTGVDLGKLLPSLGQDVEETTEVTTPESPEESGKEVPGLVRPVVKPEAPKLAEVPGMVGLANGLNRADATVMDDMGVLSSLIREYVRYVGEVPGGGLNEEIVESFRGKNKKGFVFMSEDHGKVNAAGLLTDRYGNPYFFHPVSKDRLDVISAGKDGKLYTDDDVKAF